MVVYCLEHPITKSPIYIGQTKNIKSRFGRHIQNVKHQNRLLLKMYSDLHIIYKESGLLPTFTILEKVNDSNKLKKEAAWIKKYKRAGYDLYNIVGTFLKKERATHHLIIRKDQHRRLHSIAKKNKKRITEVVDILIKEFENCYLEDKI